ncbi:hypothetical protein T440DRAFT_475730 [Plenodomus tracheiphilus IPT5]|uniref:Non-haem dioxygenase N-terminal domain-containing protein n=1 Tax=Plenodomus tracheiphilus IPT5 TaxID=1408161 RepID=A0A6A7BGR5_9PLEO|nr:hypothetical protein T440DRAFT_475730 [Plenodomus tracheiphilus IPT5]
MSTSANIDLPIIDYIRPHFGDAQGKRTPTSLDGRSRLFSALKDTGFAYPKHPSVNQSTVDQPFGHTKNFFAKPLEEKLKIKGKLEKGRRPSQGYFNPAKLAKDPKTSDLKEFFGMYSDEDKEKPNQWLSDPDSTAMRRDLIALFDYVTLSFRNSSPLSQKGNGHNAYLQRKHMTKGLLKVYR